MTTELEEQFYKTFGIEPKWKDKRVKNIKTYYTEEQAQYLRETTKNRNIQLCYPKITAEKLLEMICIMNKHIHKHNEFALCPVAGENLEEVKNYMLRLFNFNKTLLEKNFIQEIQQLFKEELK